MIKYMTPNEIPSDLVSIFDFDDQIVEAPRGLRISITCKNCNEKFYGVATQIRSNLKRGRRLTGMCSDCLKKPGSHQRGFRKPSNGEVGFKTSHGYVSVYMPEHPFAARSGHVAQHRLVMEESIGRYLEADETVHHMNGRRDDNRLSNLQLRKGQHGAGQKWECRSCGSHDIVAVDI